MAKDKKSDGGWELRRSRLESIPVERQISDMAEARDPENIIWCIKKLSEGMTWEELRRRLGVGPSHVDPRWAEMRKHILAQQEARSSDDDIFEEITEQADLRAEVQRLSDILEYDLKGLSVTDKNYAQLFKIRADLLGKLMDLNQKRLSTHQETKRGETLGRTSGVTIHIHSNIPRPEREVSPQLPQAKTEESSDE